MAKLEQLLFSFPPEKELKPQEYEKEVSEYAKRITSLSVVQWKEAGESVLVKLDPKVNSIPYLVYLTVQIEARGSDLNAAEKILQSALAFLQAFDPVQVRYVGKQWRDVFSWSAEACQALKVRDVSILGAALLRLDPSATVLTSSHIIFVRLCAALACPSQAISVLAHDYYAFPYVPAKHIPDEPNSDPNDSTLALLNLKTELSARLRAESVMEYYLLGAHIYIAVQNWPRARVFLELVILHPSLHHAVSALQVEAYKKWLLVGLLATGAAFPFLRTSDGQTMKHIKVVAKPYETLADTFEKRDWRKFRAEITAGAQIWAEDGNARLVTAASSALIIYCVSDLEKTFFALSVQRVAQHLGLQAEETLSMITDMISSGRLKATLSRSDGATAGQTTLQFQPSVSPKAAILVEQNHRIEQLVNNVRDADRRLQLTKEYADILKRNKKQNSDVDASIMDMDTSNPIIRDDGDEGDEDIMA